MTREQLSELMSAYLDGEVNLREKAMVEDALRADPAARRLLEELRQTAAVVAALPRHAAPPDLALDLDAQLERAQLLAGFRDNEFESATRRAPWQASLRAAAMLAVVLGAGWWFLSLQQEQRSDGLAKAPSRDAKELGNESRMNVAGSLQPSAPSIETELLIASGADPVVLVKQSFEPEPIRLRVVARDAAERDTLSKRLTTQLAEAMTEDLALRGVASDKKQHVGAFYLEGKVGINFKNDQEKQILVRLPKTDAEQIIDNVVAGGKIPSDQLALQVGPAIIRGQDKARGMLQTIAEQDQPSKANANKATDAPVPPPSVGLLNTLGEAVGLGPLTHNTAVKLKENNDRMATASREVSDDGRADTDGSAASISVNINGPTAENLKETTEKTGLDENAEKATHRTLVSKRLDFARAKRAEENAVSPSGNGAPGTASSSKPTTLSTSPVTTTDKYITIVIEFAIPDAKPPVRTNIGRVRS